MLRFFKYENGEFKLNREELLLIPEAKKIVFSDKGGKVDGDHDGRKKLWSMKLFGLAWWMIDVNSPGIQSGLEGKELEDDGRKALEIPSEWDSANDKDFVAFLDCYREMYNKASYSLLLKQMLMSFKDTSDIIKVTRDKTIKLLKQQKDLDAEDIRTLLTSQKELISLAGDVPKHIAKLKELQDMVLREEKEFKIARGNITVTQSMEPNE